MATRWAGPLTLVLVAAVATSGCEREAHERAENEESPEAEVVAEPLDPALAANLPPGVTIEEAQLGQRLFTVCTVCHGPDARGTQLGPSLRDAEWIHIQGEREEIAELVRSGIATPREYPVPMPPMGGGDFDEAELRALATYVYLLGRQGG